jgi:hypothetical protein
MGQPVLIVILLHRTHIVDNVKVGPARRIVVVLYIIGKAVVQPTLDHCRV